ncbi:hypothetical protein AMECASPLE_025768 [Ameca splendens]|uniref:Uncharacterized protein n=1 Tax=Ameca splendens TaxID=208324 RepID=A0ABV1AB20_9TELE
MVANTSSPECFAFVVQFLPDLSQSSVMVLATSWNWTEPGKRGFFPDTYPLPGGFPRKLLNIRESSLGFFSPSFIDPRFTELVASGATALYGILRRKRQRGKRAGALVKLRKRGHHCLQSTWQMSAL